MSVSLGSTLPSQTQASAMEKLHSSEQGTSRNPQGYKAVSLVIPLSAVAHKSDCMSQWLKPDTNLPRSMSRGDQKSPLAATKKSTPNSQYQFLENAEHPPTLFDVCRMSSCPFCIQTMIPLAHTTGESQEFWVI